MQHCHGVVKASILSYIYHFLSLTGAAFNLLVAEEDKRNMRKIEQHFNRNVPEVTHLVYCIVF